MKYGNISSRPKRRGPNTSQWTISKYFEEVFVPERQLNIEMSDRTIELYKNTVAMFNRFAGRKVKLREVDDSFLRKFELWNLNQGTTQNTAKERSWTIKRIARHWRPDRHPKQAPGNRIHVRHWEDVDCEGSLEQIFQSHYLTENPRITSDATISHYGRAFKLFGQCIGGVARLEDLTDFNVGKFLRWLVDERKVKAVSANGYAKQLKAIWNWAAKRRLVEHFPTVGKLPQPEVTPKAWTRKQLEDLLYACKQTRGLILGIRASDWLLAFHLVQWDSGERTGAMLALEWKMLDVESGHLTVPASIRKGRQKAMSYRLKGCTLESLRAIRKPERDLVFPTGRKGEWFYRYYKDLVKRAGLPYERWKSGPQKMRRTFASFIKAAGGDPTRALRHSTTRVTDDSYLDPAIADPEPPNTLLFDLSE